MKAGQQDLTQQIEDTTRCCENYDCQFPGWRGLKCASCEKTCDESCYHFLGANNARMRELRYFQGKFEFRRLPKDESLAEGFAHYRALEDNPLCKEGGRVIGAIVEFRKERSEEKNVAQ